MLIEALTTAAGPPGNPVFRDLPSPKGFEGGRCHIKEGEQFDVPPKVANQKLAIRQNVQPKTDDQPAYEGDPIFRAVTAATAEDF